LQKTALSLALVAGLAASGAAQAALVDRGGGLIYDDVLNITWLQNIAHGAGSIYDWGYEYGIVTGYMTWNKAMAWADSLSYYDSVRGVTYNDWRLPMRAHADGSAVCGGFNCTKSELGHMFYTNMGATAGQSILAGTNTANLQLFTNLAQNSYWFGESFPGYYAWELSEYGRQFVVLDEVAGHFAWAVRSGDVAAVPEVSTWAMLMAGLALVGAAARRRRG
jgi:hypothetical protein